MTLIRKYEPPQDDNYDPDFDEEIQGIDTPDQDFETKNEVGTQPTEGGYDAKI